MKLCLLAHKYTESLCASFSLTKTQRQTPSEWQRQTPVCLGILLDILSVLFVVQATELRIFLRLRRAFVAPLPARCSFSDGGRRAKKRAPCFAQGSGQGIDVGKVAKKVAKYVVTCR